MHDMLVAHTTEVHEEPTEPSQSLTMKKKRLSKAHSAHALAFGGRDFSHTTVEEAMKMTGKQPQSYLEGTQATKPRTIPELAVPAGAPPQQQQQLAAASTSRKREAPAANKSRAAKQEASSAGTSLEFNLKHVTVTLATWDVVWEVYLDPKWARQRLRLYGARDQALEQFFKKLEGDMAEVSMERHGHAKKLVVFFGAAGIGTRGGWGDDAVLRACCKVVLEAPSKAGGLLRPAWSQQRDQPVRGLMWFLVVAPRKPPQPPGSSQAATQPAAPEPGPGPSTPLPAKRSKRTKAEPEAAEPTKGKGKGKAAKAKLTPQPGRWLDRDCNAALNMQRIGESRWRSLELCWWSDQAKLPAKGKECPGLGYKRLRDQPPKAQQQQQQPAVAQ
ncbi:hypothetical protein QJQ45_012554 [Haematococcus lacustris]|nr:hypothetical protein QJQ45_012554 [Haematococcus lacustris]